MIKIKICRVENIQDARLCGHLNVDMIGLHAIYDLGQERAQDFAQITRELQSNYSKTVPVLITKITDEWRLGQMLSFTGIEWIQIHVPLDQDTAGNLIHKVRQITKKKIRYIAVVAADDPMAKSRSQALSLLADYILIDKSYQGGTGKQASEEIVRAIILGLRPAKCLIAGGLTVENVGQILANLEPDGVDVQSSLETNQPGRPKDPIRLHQFVSMVKKYLRDKG